MSQTQTETRSKTMSVSTTLTAQAAEGEQPPASDLSAVREKYEMEKQKRLHINKWEQSHKVNSADIKSFLRDPWAPEKPTREPVSKTIDVAIIGGGFGGQLIAAQLSKSGVQDFLILDKAYAYGGAWYWNRYPGASCDTESYIYMPLLEETGTMPTEKYAAHEEIFAHAQKIGRHFGLHERTVFGCNVNDFKWSEETSRWELKSESGDTISARFLVLANGMQHLPKFAALPGLELFKKGSFHTSRWDYGITGGSPSGDLHKLKGKRVAIVGSGASSVQIVPHLAESAEHVYVFQRTPSPIMERPERKTDAGWAEKMKQTPGWQRQRYENFNAIVSGHQQNEDLVNDSWTITMHNLPHWTGKESSNFSEESMNKQNDADIRMMDKIRSRVDEFVKEGDKAEQLKPWYNLFCKRPCFNNTYLPAFNRDNVTLVDASQQSIERIDENGLWAGDKYYELDLIVYATGYEYGTDFCDRLGADVLGRGGSSLRRKWKEGGYATYHGTMTSGFPNLFLTSMAQGGYTQNNTHALAERAVQISYIVSTALSKGARSVEPSQRAERDWVQRIVDLAGPQYEFLSSCTPGYYNMYGASREKWSTQAMYGNGSPEFFEMMQKWRDAGKLEGLLVQMETSSTREWSGDAVSQGNMPSLPRRKQREIMQKICENEGEEEMSTPSSWGSMAVLVSLAIGATLVGRLV